MKILFCDNRESDWGSAFLFAGLKQLLGEDNVVDYPNKVSYHGQVDNYESIYGDGNPGITQPFDWMPAYKVFDYTEDDIVRNIKEYNLIVLASPRQGGVVALRRLVQRIGIENMPPIVFTDSEDYDDIHYGLMKEFDVRVGFKRMVLKRPDCLCLPYPFASVTIDLFPSDNTIEKEYDVFYQGILSNLERIKIAGVIEKMDIKWIGGLLTDKNQETILTLCLGQGFKNIIGKRLTYNEYIKTMVKSKIVISSSGYSADTPKFWEAAGLNTLMITDRNELKIPNNYINGNNIGKYRLEDLGNIIEFYLTENTLRQKIVDRQVAHTNMFHTCKKRAAYVLYESCNRMGMQIPDAVWKIRKEQKAYCMNNGYAWVE